MKLWPYIILIFALIGCKAQRHTQPVKQAKGVQKMKLVPGPGPEQAEGQLIFRLRLTSGEEVRFSIPDSLKSFYHRGKEITDPHLRFLSPEPENLEIGGGMVDDRAWYLTWMSTGDKMWERCLISDKPAQSAPNYELENKAYYGYNLDVIGYGTEASKKLFVNGKLVEAEYIPSAKHWRYHDSFGTFKNLFSLSEYYVKCCPEAIFNR